MNKVNAKEYPGGLKPGIESVPVPVMREVGEVMRNGAGKYGYYNWRQGGCSASTYYNATWRHISSWWEGEELDSDDGIHHLSHAIASLMVLRDAQLHNIIDDDRPPHVLERDDVK